VAVIVSRIATTGGLVPASPLPPIWVGKPCGLSGDMGHDGCIIDRMQERLRPRIAVDPEYYPELRALKLRYEANSRTTVSWTDFLKFLVSRALPEGVVGEGSGEGKPE